MGQEMYDTFVEYREEVTVRAVSPMPTTATPSTMTC